MTDIVVMALTGLLALGLLGWTVWSIWHVAHHTPPRHRALTHVLGILAGTVELGVALPAVLMGAVDPFPVWLVFAVLAVAATVALVWRWPALKPGKWGRPGLMIASGVLLIVLATAGIAVT
ncbi:hypothetical protein [Amnibacterium sp.]|uniref:hypothetical protein n=1 Tax=Amnibacterium sp. TaxID=1872496 RepID=UPI0026315D1B|nr:hypothetical protein [Amnibacterium sp.]MCU1472115.1 hypothetical protein [Amnibacterium sp.]